MVIKCRKLYHDIVGLTMRGKDMSNATNCISYVGPL